MKNAVLWDVNAMWLLRATRRNIPEIGILHSHRRENPKAHNKT
jgi:hypothetical protein